MDFADVCAAAGEASAASRRNAAVSTRLRSITSASSDMSSREAMPAHDAGQPHRSSAASMSSAQPLHQHVRLALLVVAAVGALDLVEAARAIERYRTRVALKDPKPQRRVFLHRTCEQGLPYPTMLAFRPHVEMIDPAVAERD